MSSSAQTPSSSQLVKTLGGGALVAPKSSLYVYLILDTAGREQALVYSAFPAGSPWEGTGFLVTC